MSVVTAQSILSKKHLLPQVDVNDYTNSLINGPDTEAIRERMRMLDDNKYTQNLTRIKTSLLDLNKPAFPHSHQVSRVEMPLVEVTRDDLEQDNVSFGELKDSDDGVGNTFQDD